MKFAMSAKLFEQLAVIKKKKERKFKKAFDIHHLQ